MRERHPRIGGLLLALFDDPQSTKAWSIGAAGERAVGARLQSVTGDGVVVLHDRRIPRSRANIDHVVVCSLGVYVIDAKRYADKRIECRIQGSVFRPEPPKLFVGGRDKTGLVQGMDKQVDAVRGVLADVAPEMPITPVLCFVDGLWVYGRSRSRLGAWW